MKVTAVGRGFPIGGLTGLPGGGGSMSGTDPNTGQYPPSGQVPVATGSNTWAWASNLQTAWANASNQLLGPHINFQAGSGIDLAQASNTLTISALGGGGSLSYGSNSNSVSAANAPGASTLVSRADHVHQGVHQLSSNGSNSLFNDVNLQAGTGIALGVSGQTITVTNTGSSGGGGSSITDYVSGVSGSGHITIPEIAIDPRIIPGGGSDKEFDTTTIGGTALGSPTTIDANTTYAHTLYVKKSAAASFSLQGRYWTPPSTPFTMTVHFVGGSIPRADFMRLGCGIAESTPGKTEGIYLEFNTGRYVSTISSTSPTAGAAYVQQGDSRFHQMQWPLWFRVVAASSTDVTWKWSSDGKIFTTFGTANRNPGFTIGSVFVSCHPEQATHDVEMIVGSIRFT